MNKELLELLDAINAKKATIKNLIKENKIDDAKKEKSELVSMQEKFDLMKDLFDGETEPAAVAGMMPASAGHVDSVKAFVNAVRTGFKNVMSEGSGPDGGYTVPEDIQTQIRQYRDEEFNLSQLVTVENVKTDTGSRTYQKKGDIEGFSQMDEGGRIEGMKAPGFSRVSYAIKKFGGYLGVTYELLADTEQNIVSTISRWVGGQSRVTRNKLIIKALSDGKTPNGESSPVYVPVADIDGITKILNVTLGTAYKPYSKIITNDFGLQELCELKDASGRPLVNPIPTEPAKLQIACGALVVPVEVIPTAELPNIVDAAKTYAPLIIGDLKSAVTLFDRQKVTITSSDTAVAGALNAFEQGLMLYRAVEREDVKVVDSAAYVLARFSTELTA